MRPQPSLCTPSFAAVAAQSGFVSLDATAGWLNSSAEPGIVATPVVLLLIGRRIRFVDRLDCRRYLDDRVPAWPRSNVTVSKWRPSVRARAQE
jgi:hypothetical protein